jgi:hypothetical protein
VSRTPRQGRGTQDALGRESKGTQQEVPAAIIAHITRIRHRLARFLAPDLTWDRDISLENDRLRVENETLRDRIHELEKHSA